MFPDLSQYPVVAIDVETFGVDWVRDRMFGVAISTPDGQDHYFDTREHPRVLEWLRDEAPHIQGVVNHNLDFDLHMMANEGVRFNLERCECTMIRAALIDEHRLSYKLDDVAKDCIGAGKDSTIYKKLADMFGGPPSRTCQMKNLNRAPSSLVSPYATRDTRVALDLWQWQEVEIARQNLGPVWALEKRLFPHVFDMERRGIRVDVNIAEATMKRLKITIKAMQKELDSMAGFPVNPNPSGSIQKLFNPKWVDRPGDVVNKFIKKGSKIVRKKGGGHWVARDGTILPTTDGGKPSIGAEQLRAMKDPAAKLILQCRKYMKAMDTFVAKHILAHHKDGYVHPNINQTRGEASGEAGDEGTRTGRLSYTRPALQQIPARDKEIAAIIRPIFKPDPGMGWSYGDLDQHEFRVFAHYTNSPALIDAYQENPDLDIHAAVAKMTGLPRSASYSGQANAKQMNLAMVFNMGGGTLAEKMGLPFTMEMAVINGHEIEFKNPGEEAKEVMARYYAAIPGVKELSKQAKNVAAARGFIRTLMGRHIRFPGRQFTHKASGLLYQGTSADLNKDCVCRVAEYLRAECPVGRLLLNIHDEFNLSLPMDGNEIQHLKAIKAEIQRRPELRVPIRVDFSALSGDWWEANNAEIVTK